MTQFIEMALRLITGHETAPLGPKFIEVGMFNSHSFFITTPVPGDTYNSPTLPDMAGGTRLGVKMSGFAFLVYLDGICRWGIDLNTVSPAFDTEYLTPTKHGFDNFEIPPSSGIVTDFIISVDAPLGPNSLLYEIKSISTQKNSPTTLDIVYINPDTGQSVSLVGQLTATGGKNIVISVNSSSAPYFLSARNVQDPTSIITLSVYLNGTLVDSVISSASPNSPVAISGNL